MGTVWILACKAEGPKSSVRIGYKWPFTAHMRRRRLGLYRCLFVQVCVGSTTWKPGRDGKRILNF